MVINESSRWAPLQAIILPSLCMMVIWFRWLNQICSNLKGVHCSKLHYIDTCERVVVLLWNAVVYLSLSRLDSIAPIYRWFGKRLFSLLPQWTHGSRNNDKGRRNWFDCLINAPARSLSRRRLSLLLFIVMMQRRRRLCCHRLGCSPSQPIITIH